MRAKDVQLLFADSSTGANSPALVRQGQISELIASKPQNRRRILEEAAGISGLHTRRHEAELRLRGAETNLERLDDVLAQIEAQLNQLRRQSRQARRFKRLAGEIYEHRALLWLKRWQSALEALIAAEAEGKATAARVADAAGAASQTSRAALEADEQLPPAREEMMVAAAVMARLQSARDGLERDEAQARAELDRLEGALRQVVGDLEREEDRAADAVQAQARLAEEAERLQPAGAMDGEIAEAEAAANTAFQSRSDLEGLVNEMTRRHADRLARREGAERRRDQAGARLERLRADKEATQARLDALSAGAGSEAAEMESAAKAALTALREAREAETALREAWEATEGEVEAARSELSSKRRALGELEAEQKALIGMLRPAGTTAHTPALDHLEVEPGYEQALAAALGEDLDAAILEDAPTSWRGAEHGAPTFPAGTVVLADVVKAPPELEARLRHVGVVATDSLYAPLQPGQRLVTREGALRRWDGLEMRAGAPTAAALKLQNQNRLGQVEAQIGNARAEVDATDAAHGHARRLRESRRDAHREARRALPDLEARERAAQGALSRWQAEQARQQSERAALEDKLESLAGDLRELEDARDLAEADLAEVGDTTLLETERTQLEARLRTARDDADEASARYRALKAEADSREARRAALERDQKAWDARGTQARERLEELSRRKAKLESKLQDARRGPDPFAERRARLLGELSTAEARQVAAKDALEALEATAREASARARAAESEHSSAREARAGAEARLEAAGAKVEDVAARIAEALQCDPAALPQRLGSLSPDSPQSEPDLERRIDKLVAERERLGNVNLRADEESEEQQARLDTLSAEREDLEAAIAKLREGIDELNAEGRARLLAAFDTVNAHFRRLFTTLFQGGEAELRLTESDDPLHAGLEILAAPPGKDVKAMSLLSGGEQALTATALIFAVFLSNPAPICVLDEVDAPLDDANVARYCDLLDEMSRTTQTKFIAITHNPVTMSRMDRLFGVTMAERGVSQLLSVRLQEAEELVAAE